MHFWTMRRPRSGLDWWAAAYEHFEALKTQIFHNRARHRSALPAGDPCPARSSGFHESKSPQPFALSGGMHRHWAQ